MLRSHCILFGLLFIHSDISQGYKMQINLATITWAHAVNDKAYLNSSLNSGIDMLEADIVIGRTADNKENNIPIMGHPPNNVSDLSLSQFVSIVDEFNKRNAAKKGIKLDFKCIEAFESAIRNEEFSAILSKANYPVWLNADILEGPLAHPQSNPVDATLFIKGGKLFPRSVLSLGWTTGFDATKKVGYTESNVREMLRVLETNEVRQPVTFAVRAGLVAESKNEMNKLLSNNTHTLTVWSAINDEGFDVDKLNDVLDGIGIRRIYVDVPDELKSQLNLLNSTQIDA
ncbi:hypothetical protein WA026_014074 [Henosepilachna vigintioctopunctata]|uniref:Menorin-like domain-containing protein n=1 Tax=Henosepilachna vigintioctopunctata TaxID=420089 RepID=A0AAW1U9J5_9CUCU